MTTLALLLTASGCAGPNPDALVDAAPAPADLGAPPDLERYACAPVDVGFLSTLRPPRNQRACTSDEVPLVISDWLHGTPAERQQFETDHPVCFACAVSQDADPTRGPILHHRKLGFSEANVPGCFYFVDGDASPSSCMARIQAYQDCTLASCAPGCDGHSQAHLTALDQCRSQATSSVCDGFALASNGCGQAKYAVCNPASSTSPDAYAQSLVLAFCGPGK
jgi:hypothetical protein